MIELQDIKRENGFTIVEVLIAMFILLVGILAVISMFTTSIKANQLGRNVTVANRLAQNLMEQVKTQTFSNAVADMCTATGITPCSATDSSVPGTITRTGTFQEASGGINLVSYNVSLQQVEDTPIAGLNTVTVTVTWSDAYGSHTTKLITYMEKT